MPQMQIPIPPRPILVSLMALQCSRDVLNMAYTSMIWPIYLCSQSFPGTVRLLQVSSSVLRGLCHRLWHQLAILRASFTYFLPSDFRVQPSCPYRTNCWEQLKNDSPFLQWFNQPYLVAIVSVSGQALSKD